MGGRNQIRAPVEIGDPMPRLSVVHGRYHDAHRRSGWGSRVVGKSILAGEVAARAMLRMGRGRRVVLFSVMLVTNVHVCAHSLVGDGPGRTLSCVRYRTVRGGIRETTRR